MKRLLLTALAATLLAPVSAHAHPLYHYTGGCAIAGPVGAGPGIPYVAVVATYSDGTPAPTAPITATCALYRGSVAQGVIAGPASGFGTAAATGSPTVVLPLDVLCEGVDVNGEFHSSCRTL